ncbi:MAG: response regulator [Clostridia bacterium]|nr:response regulator [Clostridia bacterium]
MNAHKRSIAAVSVAAGVILALILILGTVWMGQSGKRDSEKAVRSVSLLYLDELAGRREQVVANNLQDKIGVIRTALELMTDEDLSDRAHLQAYQARIKRLFVLEKFAFVDTDGQIYTSLGMQTDIDQYQFDHLTLNGPEISIKNVQSADKKVIIALPVQISFEGKTLVVCFMEIDMQEMLSGVSMNAQANGATFCNIYTNDGIPLSTQVLGGLAAESNLLEAMRQASFEAGYSYDAMAADFAEGRRGEVCFAYRGVTETLSYVPVEGTNWLLTYLIRESVISENISAISNGIITRSVIQSILTILVLSALFAYIISQSRKTARLRIEKETSEAENRVKQADLEQRLALQEQLLEQKARQEQQEKMITALASDYRSVYYIELDKDAGICYQARNDLPGFHAGDRFRYLQAVTDYCNTYVLEQYRAEFLRFIQPDAIRNALRESRVISYRYMVRINGKESYEMVRFAGVRRPEDREDHTVRNVGACFTDVDAETRMALEQQQALSEALAGAEQANKAKTAFLSNMSHEIRTPMNAIIGLNNIAVNDPSASDKMKEYLGKIGASAQHLLGIINDILDMSRIESGRMVIKNEEFSFAKSLEQVNTIISGQCREKGLDYECRLVGKIDNYYIGDDMKLKQVMINILGNAVKFTPEGGKVRFVIEEGTRFDQKAVLKFTISDTGIGMSKEYLPHLFDAFSQEDSSSTNRYGSTGLGMPITKSIVELMNGRIDVESEKGKGTTFTVTVTLGESERKDLETGDGDLNPREMSVLVIDDDPIALEHAHITLSQVGISCEVAQSGAIGLDMVKLRHARRNDYDLILIDWRMPDMDGVETTRQIRAIVGHDTPIIILTSFNWDDIVDEAKAAGVDTFVSKPLFAGSVLDEFREAFKRKNAALVVNRANLKGRRILLAEDVAVNAEIMVMVLSMREIDVDVAENGRIAVEKFSANPAGYYDAILMDMRMPEMDGLEATRVIRAMERQDAKEIPIIALTANAFDEDVQRSMQAGLNAHLSKPVEPEALFDTLESLIKS